MRRFSAIVAIALATLLLVSICLAQQTATTSVPNLIRYSGTLKDAQGAALSSSTAVGVTFSIYNQQDGGAPVWQETQNITPDANGQYSVILGSTTATGLPDDLFSQQEQRWLGVQVQGQDEQARVLLVSVPYAFKAHEAETLGGLPASAFVQAAPSNASGSASTDAGTAINALSNTRNANISSKGKTAAASRKSGLTTCTLLTANASANYIPIFDPTVCNLVNSAIYQLGSNVGIGTQTPSTALEVNGAITADQWYDITTEFPTAESPFLSIGWPGTPVDYFGNTWLGLLAGGQGSTVNTTDIGVNNTFVGYAAFDSNQKGSANTGVGFAAGAGNTSGKFNTYVGVNSGSVGIDSGNINNNTFSGFESGFANSGANNVFYGYMAGAANTANGNSFFGYQSGLANTSGSSDTYLGKLSGTANKTGSGNTFVGDSAGAANVTGNDNTFTGQNAGKVNTVSGNSFYGYQAGTSNTTGNLNSFIGINTGFNSTTMLGNTIGSQNTYVGAGAGGNDPDIPGVSTRSAAPHRHSAMVDFDRLASYFSDHNDLLAEGGEFELLVRFLC